MKLLLSIILAIFHISCNFLGSSEPTMNEKKDIFKTVVFDKEIIADFAKYDSLAQLLLSNLDSIIKYKNERNEVIVIDNNKETHEFRDENCYVFFPGNDRYHITKIPAYLSIRVDSLWNLVKQPQVQICKEREPSAILIRKECRSKGNRILECHFLYWKLKTFDNNDSFDFVKDTLLSKDCVYRIGIATEYSGW